MSGITMDRQELQALVAVAELAKDIKTEADLNALSRELLKLTVEAALNAELSEHLDYEKRKISCKTSFMSDAGPRTQSSTQAAPMAGLASDKP